MSRPPRVDSELYAEDANELITGEAVALDLRPTSFVLRAAGAIIDFLVYVGAFVLALIVLSVTAEPLGIDDAVAQAIMVVTVVCCTVIAPMLVETFSQGKSLGRLAVGARIVRDDGGAISLRHAFVRSLLGVFEIFMTLGGLAAIVALFNRRSKRLGDFLAGTYSQHERVSQATTLAFGVPVPLVEWARTADVARMPDALARRIASFLAHATGFTPASRARLAASLANEASVFVSPVPAADPELFLAAVTALRRDREFAALQLERAGLDRLAPVLDGLPRGFPDRG